MLPPLLRFCGFPRFDRSLARLLCRDLRAEPRLVYFPLFLVPGGPSFPVRVHGARERGLPLLLLMLLMLLLLLLLLRGRAPYNDGVFLVTPRVTRAVEPGCHQLHGAIVVSTRLRERAFGRVARKPVERGLFVKAGR